MASPPTSPTVCRPQHLDRERLRRVLASSEFASVGYHEAVVIVDGGSTGFKLLAVTADAVLLFPLGKFHEVPTRLPWTQILRVERVSPTQRKLRGIMIYQNSELFQIVVENTEKKAKSDERLYYVATFEPLSKAFFYVSRGVNVHFQRAIFHTETTPLNVTTADAELALQLESLLEDVVKTQDAMERSHLFTELASAVACQPILQRLCFQDQSRLPSLHGGSNTMGLIDFLVNEVTCARYDGFTKVKLLEASLEYELSLLHLLANLLFGGIFIIERLPCFRRVPLETWKAALTRVFSISTDLKSERSRVLVEEILEMQAAVLLEVLAAQEEASILIDPNYLHHHTTISKLIALHNDRTWVGKLFKRACISLSRAPKELPTTPSHGSLWSISLWRIVTLLLALLEESDGHLALWLASARQDYLK
ncbi:hypothetical protein Poli38472_006339 [Pythium oligandrum]|uniref:Uncharacterized protein n=1 Tax=Pythium oligandrum TaxID=41045 RepID=A0A8K1C4J8_PYTOL|nr:hypothetical protein Poli38472_006339 [Pythium oligandrum]|eukprot:TMW56329.1 hypothetical protein Poli38472_006339 [Pythium oligandrum]